MNKVVIRSLSGIIYIGVIVGCILLGVNAVTILALLLGLIALLEFNNISGQLNKERIAPLMLDYAGLAVILLGCYHTILLPLWPVLMIVRCVEELYLKDKNPVSSLSRSVFSQFYLGIPLGLMQNIETFNHTSHGYALLAIFIMIWLNDTGAFCVGSLIGRRKLFERISPNKSWEGFFGGLLFTLIAAFCFCAFCPSLFAIGTNYYVWGGLALVVTLFSTWGDLLESLFKRTYAIKDSGHWIPGHGGILDRIDSLLLVSPAAAAYLQFCFSAGLI